MSGELNIRVAEKDDLAGVLELYGQPVLDDGEVLDRETADSLLEKFKTYPDYKLYVACLEQCIVGTFALLIMDNLGHCGKPSAVVEDVAVAPDRQRQGIGRLMMEFAMEQSRWAGCYKLTLSAAAHRANAHRFYESLGFERHGYSFSVPLEKRLS